MKRYLSKFKFTKEFIQTQILECMNRRTGNCLRWFRKDTSYFFAEYLIQGGFVSETNIHKVAKEFREKIKGDATFYLEVVIPYIAECLLTEILTGKIKLRPIIYQDRVDSSSMKVRKIGLTTIKQQVFDYIAVAACMEMFRAKIGAHQCSSIKGRGQIYAKRHIERWIRRKFRKARYVAKFDVRKYYPSIRHDLLFKKLERDIKNADVLYLIKTLVGTYSSDGIGLCIGTYLSQFLANYYLSYAWHYIAEQAVTYRKARRTGEMKRVRLTNYNAFYMDDISLFASNKKYLRMAVHMMIDYLRNELGLELKHGGYQVIDLFKPGNFLDMVGFRFYKKKTIIRRRVFRRICKCIKGVKRNINNIGRLRSMMSRHGFIKNSDSNNFRRKCGYDRLFELARERLKIYDAESKLLGAPA